MADTKNKSSYLSEDEELDDNVIQEENEKIEEQIIEEDIKPSRKLD